MKRYLLAASIVLAAASSAAAGRKATITYDCAIKVFTNNGWIAPRVLVIWDEENQSAQIYDGYIHKLIGEPIPAKVEPRNEISYNLDWRVNNIPVSNARMTLDGLYSGVLNTKQNTLSICGVITGVANQPRGKGKCIVKKD